MTDLIKEKTEEYFDSAVILLSELISYASVKGEAISPSLYSAYFCPFQQLEISIP